MSQRWRVGCALLLLLFTLGPCLAGASMVTRARRLSPPPELFSLGPLWIGDMCRDNVAHGRYPPGWCPDAYTVYVVLRTQPRSVIYPVGQLPERVRRR
jgi:hypothetical protein